MAKMPKRRLACATKRNEIKIACTMKSRINKPLILFLDIALCAFLPGDAINEHNDLGESEIGRYETTILCTLSNACSQSSLCFLFETSNASMCTYVRSVLLRGYFVRYFVIN